MRCCWMEVVPAASDPARKEICGPSILRITGGQKSPPIRVLLAASGKNVFSRQPQEAGTLRWARGTTIQRYMGIRSRPEGLDSGDRQEAILQLLGIGWRPRLHPIYK